MKKLLALVLCVMMFVSVLSTSAFAATTATAWPSKQVSVNAIKEAQDSIKNIYATIAVDEAVFSTAKTLHDFADGLAKGLFADTDSITNGTTKVYHDALVDNARDYLKGIIGATITKYMNDHAYQYQDTGYANGIDAADYAKTFAKAVNEAVGTEKAQKGIEAFAYNLIMANVQNDMKDRAEDLQDAMKDWGTGKWDAFGFGPYYSVAPAQWDSPVMDSYIAGTTDGETNMQNVIDIVAPAA